MSPMPRGFLGSDVLNPMHVMSEKKSGNKTKSHTLLCIRRGYMSKDACRNKNKLQDREQDVVGYVTKLDHSIG